MSFFDYDIPKESFEELHNHGEGLVFLGCGGNLQDWYKGIVEEVLEKEKLATREDFKRPFSMTTTGGRTDLVLPFKPGGKIDMGKLAMWRLRFGDCSWISDYITNYKKHHNVDGHPSQSSSDDEEM